MSDRRNEKGFVPVTMYHPNRQGTRRAGTPAQLVQLKADGWRPRVPKSLNAGRSEQAKTDTKNDTKTDRK